MKSAVIEKAASAVRAARQNLRLHDELVRTEEERLSALRSRASLAQAEFDAVARKVADRNLEATLADLPLPPEDPKSSEELRRLQATIRAAEEAIPVVQRGISELRRRRPDLVVELSRAFGPWKAAVLEGALGKIGSSFAEMHGPIATLMALDHVQTALLGTNFVTDSKVDKSLLISSGHLMQRLLDGIPKRCRPEELAEASLDDQAAIRATEFHTLLENQK